MLLFGNGYRDINLKEHPTKEKVSEFIIIDKQKLKLVRIITFGFGLQ
jgi:hypothetical protein